MGDDDDEVLDDDEDDDVDDEAGSGRFTRTIVGNKGKSRYEIFMAAKKQRGEDAKKGRPLDVPVVFKAIPSTQALESIIRSNDNMIGKIKVSLKKCLSRAAAGKTKLVNTKERTAITTRELSY